MRTRDETPRDPLLEAARAVLDAVEPVELSPGMWRMPQLGPADEAIEALRAALRPALASSTQDALDVEALMASTDGLAATVSTILRKYGGTMKGRGDHDIFDALVRYRAAILAARGQQ